MKVAVKDANVLIDLVEGDLLVAPQVLPPPLLPLDISFHVVEALNTSHAPIILAK